MDSPTSPVILAPSAPSTVSDLESVIEVNPRFRDKETPESHLVDSENMNVPTRPITPDCDGKPLFDTGDGDIELWVNDACFETHKYLVKRFAGLRDLLLDQPSGKALRVHTEGYDIDDFRRMFKVLYASIIEGPFKFDNTTLISALRIATVYDHPNLRVYAVKHLEDAQLTAIERIKIAREFGLESWEEPAYQELCERDEAITTQEAGVLGLNAFVHVAGIREREQRRRGKEDARATALQPFPSSTNTTQSQANEFGGTFAGFGSGTRAGIFGNTSSTAGGFGTAATGSVFGAAKPAGDIFGSTTTAAPTSGQGVASLSFGSTNTTNPLIGSPFGQPQQNPPQQQTSIFGQPAQPATQSPSPFGQNTQTTSAFGQPANKTTSTGPFGQPTTNTGTSLFGQPAQQQQGTTSAFGLATTNTTNASKGRKVINKKSTIAGAFGTTTTQPAATKPDTTNALGQNNQAGQTYSIFGQPQQNQQQPTSTGSSSGGTHTASKPSLFGQPEKPTTSLFGQPARPAQTIEREPEHLVPADLSGQKSKGNAGENTLRPESKTPGPSSHPESACDKQREADDSRAQTDGSAQNSEIKTNPSFINTRLGHDYTCSEWTSSSGSECQLKISDCNCRFLDKSGAVQSESSCLIAPCSAKAFKALQTQQLAHARSIATLESTVKELTAAPSSAPEPAQDSTTSSTIQAEVRLMLGTLRKPQAGA